ncbi:GHKL domain-containing protein [Desulfosporosinus sp. Sb-LF]|uniref:sensor histidine kinase n=1 Tax=Desulfosporosinus sp. Sb-LF TaxID=2560027 RepID=UPI00107EF5C6|nr:GHKL domain-containing protein [Desulfosporosinus sp. Sb-LF]TGE32560.1 GHKL domain-containing protein [Desulfosporosinus sp. Sb-LF]
MSTLLPDFLRGTVTDIMNILLMLTLLQPKYGKKVTGLGMAGILTVNLLVNGFGYLTGNLTLLAKLDFILWIVICFGARPLFRDSFMQWLFSVLTVWSLSLSVMVLSFSLSRLMPYPMYANTLVRLVLYAGILFLLHRYVRPLYRQIVESWHVFFYVAVALTATLSYYFVSGEDVVRTLTEQAVPIHLLVLVTVAVYVSIVFSLKTLSREYALREENLRMQNNQELLHVSASAMADRIKLLDASRQQSCIAEHDRRHFNHTLQELLEQHKTEDAIAFLKQQVGAVPAKVRNYCENTAVNAAVCYYAGLAEDKGITTDMSLDIPNALSVDSLELAMVISNLIENAIQACEGVEKDRERTIRFICRQVGRLALEISNPSDGSAALDEKGHPIAKENGHGAGTKSVLAFVEKYDGEILYQIADDIFRVRMLV